MMISKDRNETVRKTDTHYFFWKSKFSQWYQRDFIINNITYNCCEQYMMGMKAKLFKDDEAYKKIMASDSPAFQKRTGRQVKNYNDEEWQKICRKVVFNANLAKFTQHEDLKELLLSTEDRAIVEASPYDALWGIALGPWNDKALDEKNWRGKNWLGIELTKVREKIKNEKESIYTGRL
jgi:hypothetical protein